MLITATAEGSAVINWLAYVLILFAALGFSLGLRHLSALSENYQLRRWVPAAHVGIWVLAVGIVVAGVAAQGFTTTLVVVILAIIGAVAAGMGWLKSVVAGLVLFSEAELSTGDRIQVGEHRGEVIRIGVRSVQLCDVEGVVHDIPHTQLIDSPVSRFSDAADAACEFVMQFDTDEDPPQVLESIRLIAGIAPLASPRRRPQVYLDEPPRAGKPLKVRIRSFPFSPDHRREYKSDLMRRLRRRLGVENKVA